MSIATRAKLIGHHASRRIRSSGRLPDFLILGAQKAGTTSLFNYLCHSPQMLAPLRKEVHYFSQSDLKPISWYEAFFPDKRNASDVTGEATPFYLFHPEVPRRIERANLSPRLVVILRSPVERAWSHYRHEKRKGRESLGFEEALRAEQERLQGTTDKILNDAHLEALQRKSYLARGRYFEQISRFMEIFGSDLLHVLSLDRLKQDPAGTVAATCEFLGIAPPPENFRYTVYNAGNEKSDLPEVAPGLFRDAFSSDLEQLRSILPEAETWLERLPN